MRAISLNAKRAGRSSKILCNGDQVLLQGLGLRIQCAIFNTQLFISHNLDRVGGDTTIVAPVIFPFFFWLLPSRYRRLGELRPVLATRLVRESRRRTSRKLSQAPSADVDGPQRRAVTPVSPRNQVAPCEFRSLPCEVWVLTHSEPSL